MTEPSSMRQDAAPWSFARRFALAFTFPLVVLANLPSPFYAIGIIRPFLWLSAFWNALVPLIAWRVLHLKVTVPMPWNDSVDTSFHYVRYLVWIALSFIVALGCSVLDRKASHYETAYRIFYTYLRFALGVSMIKYGAAKVIKNQFPYPSLDALVEPLGSASPQGLAYTFMGLSHGLNLFVGIVEMSSGILLTIRRTTVLGALLAAAALANVMAMNYGYDVPVKTIATQFLLMSGLLLLPHLRRLGNVLVLNRPAPPIEIRPLFADRRLDRAAIGVRALVVL
ncbi:MAG: hypothetical protein ABI837_10240, partial [Acidobacteriota bacterium]